MHGAEEVGERGGLREIPFAQVRAAREDLVHGARQVAQEALGLVRPGGAETHRRLEQPAGGEREEKLLRLLQRNVEGAKRHAEDGREMAAEMQPGSLLPQRRQLGREDPCARVEERPPLQPAGAVRNLAGKEGVRPGIERWQRIRILVRARGEE